MTILEMVGNAAFSENIAPGMLVQPGAILLSQPT